MAKRQASDILDDKIVDAYFTRTAHHAPLPKRKPLIDSRFGLAIFLAALVFLYLLPALGIVPAWNRPRQSKIPSKTDGLSNKIIDSGVINGYHVKRLSFENDAKQKSAFLNDSIMLVNSGRLNRASLNLELQSPLDLKNSFLFVKGKSASGIKSVNMIFTDADNRSSEVSGVTFSSKGDINNVPLDKIRNRDIDLSRISKVSIEFGTETAGNADESVIFVKDIYVRNML